MFIAFFVVYPSLVFVSAVPCARTVVAFLSAALRKVGRFCQLVRLNTRWLFREISELTRQTQTRPWNSSKI